MVPGHGVCAQIESKNVLAGNPELLRDHGVSMISPAEAEAFIQQGCTVTYVAIDGIYSPGLLLCPIRCGRKAPQPLRLCPGWACSLCCSPATMKMRPERLLKGCIAAHGALGVVANFEGHVVGLNPPFAPTPIPHPKRSRALGAPSASRYGKNRRTSICRFCGLSVFRFAGLAFLKTVFSAGLPPAPHRTAGTAPALPDQFAHRTPQWGSQADTPR